MMLVFGKTGQVTCELQLLLQNACFLSREEADLSDPEACARLIREIKPEAVINAAAYTAVDKAEDNEELARTINGAAPGEMAKVCAELGIPFVHISTDYVFDGSCNQPLSPNHATNPLGAYGRTKLAGEKLIAEAAPVHAILRTSWVFSSFGNNFVKTMLRLSETRDTLNVVSDQIGGPTSARSIAFAAMIMARQLTNAPDKTGVYHFSGKPDVSWADFARVIFADAGKEMTVNDIPSSEYPTPAERPMNSRLDCSTLSEFGLSRPDWRADLKSVLIKLGAKA
ncbi:dTDP-4-dehydrorhamnose reductase [Martelella mediterranea]|uniref:dTDP-4-dehydrorhamnose reductase n=1 Tax=Martelella mediterranea TaxID=293089 RepID=A0A4R3NGL9_9HYPH|nr:dTDP-4-dehydrorhamnose reductase [Martelella mediterranea]TCT30432.1 dTDP-4-dehydrorhamnose reductase [Martelella mediterranea]